MPDLQRVDLLTRFIFENPYPLGLLLLALGAGLSWTVLRGGDRRRLRVGVGLVAAGGVVLLIGQVVVTSGERARGVVLDLVEAAVAADVSGATQLFSEDAALALGSPTNPGYSRDAIDQRVEQLDGRYRIESNRIVKLKTHTESSQRAVVDLEVSTTPEMGFGPVHSAWLVRVERQDDGTWKITHVTWLSIAGRTPSPNLGM